MSYQDLEVQPQLSEHLPFNACQLFQQRLALLGRAQHKHLYLAELVHSVQPPACSAYITNCSLLLHDCIRLRCAVIPQMSARYLQQLPTISCFYLQQRQHL